MVNIARDLNEEGSFPDSCRGRILVFRLEGALDALESERFFKEVQQALDENDALGLLLLCEAMPYLTSSGLRSIMSLGKGLRQKGGQIVVCGLAGLSKEIFETAGFAQIFPVTETVQEAHAPLEKLFAGAASGTNDQEGAH